MQAPQGYTAWYKRVVFDGDGGAGQQECELKAWASLSDRAGWEARRIIAALGYKGRFEGEPRLFFKAAAVFFEKVADFPGFDLLAQAVPSIQSLEARESMGRAWASGASARSEKSGSWAPFG